MSLASVQRRRGGLAWQGLAASLTFHVTLLASIAWVGYRSGSEGGTPSSGGTPAAAALPLQISTPPRPALPPQPVRSAPARRFAPAQLTAALADAEILLRPREPESPPLFLPEPASLTPLTSIPPPPESTDDSPPESSASSAAASQPPSTSTRKSDATSTEAGRGTRSGPQRGQGEGAAGSGSGSQQGLAQPPRLLRSRAPAYPSSARRRGSEGSTRVRVQVDRKGRVTQSSLHHSSGDAALDASALKAVRDWRFDPALSETGAPIESEALVDVHFRLTEG
ncbi:MAG: energy transducer TonB [Verrucomicrobiales bacterium]|nr:energy transducer TonB [Verrucomicrobiales bacterium]